MSKNVLILPGDGIGPEIVAQARRVLELVNEQDNLGLEMSEALVGGCSNRCGWRAAAASNAGSSQSG